MGEHLCVGFPQAVIHLFLADIVNSMPGDQSRAADFTTALHIAQEIAFLTPSMQDRSLLPSCEAVFGTLPKEVRAAFRKFVVADGNDGQLFEVSEVLSALD
jgi:hypothetical protein